MSRDHSQAKGVIRKFIKDPKNRAALERVSSRFKVWAAIMHTPEFKKAMAEAQAADNAELECRHLPIPKSFDDYEPLANIVLSEELAISKKYSPAIVHEMAIAWADREVIREKIRASVRAKALSIDETAAKLNVSRQQVYKLIANKQLKSLPGSNPIQVLVSSADSYQPQPGKKRNAKAPKAVAKLRNKTFLESIE